MGFDEYGDFIHEYQIFMGASEQFSPANFVNPMATSRETDSAPKNPKPDFLEMNNRNSREMRNLCRGLLCP
jgi:hypothetical protein